MEEIAVAHKSRAVWPRSVQRIVKNAVASGKAQKNAVLLHEQIQRTTQFSSRVCWTFLERHNVKRPGAGRNKQWDPAMLDYVIDNGYDKAVAHFNCDRTKLYNFVKRSGRVVGHCGGDFSVYHLRRLMTVRSETILWWIETGMLEAATITYGGKDTWRVSPEQLKAFVRGPGKRIIGLHRIPEKRIGFLEEFLYEGKHMDLDLLHTRESKKEGDAFRNGEYVTRDSFDTDRKLDP